MLKYLKAENKPACKFSTSFNRINDGDIFEFFQDFNRFLP